MHIEHAKMLYLFSIIDYNFDNPYLTLSRRVTHEYMVEYLNIQKSSFNRTDNICSSNTELNSNASTLLTVEVSVIIVKNSP